MSTCIKRAFTLTWLFSIICKGLFNGLSIVYLVKAVNYFSSNTILGLGVASLVPKAFGSLQLYFSFVAFPRSSLVVVHASIVYEDIFVLLPQGSYPLSVLPPVLVEELPQVEPWSTPDALGVWELFELPQLDVLGSPALTAPLFQLLPWLPQLSL